VWRIAKQEMKEYTGAPARDVLALEQERLDAMLRTAWPAALQGDMKAVLAVLKVEDMRCRLLGLYANPPKPEGFPAPPGAVLVLPGRELVGPSLPPDLNGGVPRPPDGDALSDSLGDGSVQQSGFTDREVS
jgi:hypothetical protein